MARNWLKAFRPASFRGLPFQVDVEEASGARRLSIQPIAYAEGSVIEDMGREPRVVRLSAYVAGDIADAAAVAFSAALDRKGPGLLVLPMLAPMSMRCAAWRLSREKDRAGYVGFEIDFIEAGLASAPAGRFDTGAIADLMRVGASFLRQAFGG